MGFTHTQKGILLALIGYNFFTLSDACIKLIGNDYNVSTISFWTYFVALCLCVVFAIPQGLKKSLGSRKIFLHVVRGAFMLALSICSIFALSGGLSLATYYTVIFLCPTVTAIGARFVYKERISKIGWSIIFIGFAGIVVAYIKDASFSSPVMIYVLGVLFFGAATNLIVKPLGKNENMLTLPFYNTVVTVIAVMAYVLIYKGQSIPIPDMNDIPVFAFGGFSVFMAQMLVLQGYRIATHGYVAPTQYTQMVSGIIVGYCIFGDMPGPWVLVGAGMIIASGLLLVMHKK